MADYEYQRQKAEALRALELVDVPGDGWCMHGTRERHWRPDTEMETAVFRDRVAEGNYCPGPHNHQVPYEGGWCLHDECAEWLVAFQYLDEGRDTVRLVPYTQWLDTGLAPTLVHSPHHYRHAEAWAQWVTDAITKELP